MDVHDCAQRPILAFLSLARKHHKAYHNLSIPCKDDIGNLVRDYRPLNSPTSNRRCNVCYGTFLQTSRANLRKAGELDRSLWDRAYRQRPRPKWRRLLSCCSIRTFNKLRSTGPLQPPWLSLSCRSADRPRARRDHSPRFPVPFHCLCRLGSLQRVPGTTPGTKDPASSLQHRPSASVGAIMMREKRDGAGAGVDRLNIFATCCKRTFSLRSATCSLVTHTRNFLEGGGQVTLSCYQKLRSLTRVNCVRKSSENRAAEWFLCSLLSKVSRRGTKHGRFGRYQRVGLIELGHRPHRRP